MIALGFLAIGAVGLATRPGSIDPARLAGLRGDIQRGERVFFLGGCASCHAAPGAKGDDMRVLAGGRKFPSPFGTFIAPNISNDPDHGIGKWTTTELVNAMKFGRSPDGRHYFPAFPYTSYTRVSLGDMVDLRAFLATLPAAQDPSLPHELPFPFNVRMSMGIWKALFMRAGDVIPPQSLSPRAERGRRLVEGLGHCGACHTPRGALGNLRYDRWLRGAKNPVAKGRTPDLVALDWSAEDIAAYLKTGFTPEFDSAGAEMADVIENMARLSDADRQAIAAYIVELPAD